MNLRALERPHIMMRVTIYMHVGSFEITKQTFDEQSYDHQISHPKKSRRDRRTEKLGKSRKDSLNPMAF